MLDSGRTPPAVLVADLGSAKQLADASGLTVTTGTPAYMAPEQAFQTGGFDARADVYALGVVTFELPTGQKPFGSGGHTTLMTGRPSTPALPAIAAALAVPNGIDILLRAAMSVAPEDRPPSAKAFADALLSPGEGDWTPTRPSRPTRPTRPAVWSAAGVLFLVTTLLTWLVR